MQKINNLEIADIHTHILPNMDDGAASVEESIQIILEQQRQGITDIVLTPHFDLSGESVSSFLTRREEAFAKLTEAIEESGVEISAKLHLGAEVRYEPNLIFEDVNDLCISGTSYILFELIKPCPFNLEQTIQWLLSKGITPIIAHVERYEYLVSNTKLLDELLYSGAVFQCNASSLFNRHHAKNVKKLLKKGYVHILSSDVHGIDYRPSMLEKGLKKVSKHSDYLISNSMKIVEDIML